MRSTPRIRWTVASRGEVRNASTVSGEAPLQRPVTVRRGSSVSGSISIGMLRQANAPSSATAP